MNPVEQYLISQKEPFQTIMLYIRGLIFKTLPNIDEKLSYKIPFYYHNKKPFCYLNVLKYTDCVDIAFVQGVFLEKKFPILKDYKNRKQVRSVFVKSIEEFDELLFVDLLLDASKFLDSSKRAWNP